jgi:hypothetical protein
MTEVEFQGLQRLQVMNVHVMLLEAFARGKVKISSHLNDKKMTTKHDETRAMETLSSSVRTLFTSR